MTTSKLKIVFSVLMAALCSAYGATVRTATEGFVTNRIAQAAAAATNYTDAATTNAVKLSENKPEENARIVLWDYDAAWNNPRVAAPTNLRVGDLAPGDYENISNRVMRTISLPGDDGHDPMVYTPIFEGWANMADGAMELVPNPQAFEPGRLTLDSRVVDNGQGGLYWVFWPRFLGPLDTWHWVASEDYVDDALANYDPPIPAFVVYAEDVTNVVRGCSLGGIWDAELEVWWTPVMVGGSLTYQATTNVNLNAEIQP